MRPGSGTRSAGASTNGNTRPVRSCMRRAVASWAGVGSTPTGRAPRIASCAEKYAVPQPSSMTSRPDTSPSGEPMASSRTPKTPQVTSRACPRRLRLGVRVMGVGAGPLGDVGRDRGRQVGCAHGARTVAWVRMDPGPASYRVRGAGPRTSRHRALRPHRPPPRHPDHRRVPAPSVGSGARCRWSKARERLRRCCSPGDRGKVTGAGLGARQYGDRPHAGTFVGPGVERVSLVEPGVTAVADEPARPAGRRHVFLHLHGCPVRHPGVGGDLLPPYPDRGAVPAQRDGPTLHHALQQVLLQAEARRPVWTAAADQPGPLVRQRAKECRQTARLGTVALPMMAAGGDPSPRRDKPGRSVHRLRPPAGADDIRLLSGT